MQLAALPGSTHSHSCVLPYHAEMRAKRTRGSLLRLLCIFCVAPPVRTGWHHGGRRSCAEPCLDGQHPGEARQFSDLSHSMPGCRSVIFGAHPSHRAMLDMPSGLLDLTAPSQPTADCSGQLPRTPLPCMFIPHPCPPGGPARTAGLPRAADLLRHSGGRSGGGRWPAVW